MQKRILLNFSYLYFIINFINLPSFKSLRLLLYLQQFHNVEKDTASYKKLFFKTTSDFLINGSSLNFFFKSISTKDLSTNPYQATFSLTVGLRKVYKGFDTRLTKIKKSFINFRMLYSDLTNVSLIPSCGIHSVTSASINNIKYKNKKWKYIYSGGSFFYIKWHRSFIFFLFKNKIGTYYGGNTNTNLRLNKAEDACAIKPLESLLNFNTSCVDTVSRKPIGDTLHETFYMSIQTYFFFCSSLYNWGFH
jgi:hypothetical protein